MCMQLKGDETLPTLDFDNDHHDDLNNSFDFNENFKEQSLTRDNFNKIICNLQLYNSLPVYEAVRIGIRQDLGEEKEPGEELIV